eukprot:gnl/TRDRNA2_/TRDRNA2_48777_c1_seq1.p1 gnl/TRDRNA2_/TRDRNA2_48777_c1~~gnl/TRDRNA2_/TRDRNA2_48777_c1_seq1.p1  ORF type:complete len:929 (+),score=182.44 gnl/TRDRNA2_/TRDRNA2_48777_c1_seq1:253-2787(+)
MPKELKELITAAVRCATEATITDEATADILRPRAWDALEVIERMDVPSEAASLLLEWAARQTPADLPMAARAESMLRSGSAGERIPDSAYDMLIRIHAGTSGDGAKARKLFDEFCDVDSGASKCPSEAALIGIVLACMDSRSASLAEHVIYRAHEHGQCSLPMFSAGVKVLMAAKQPERVCALHDTVKVEGFSPDDAVYGQLIKAAVSAGRNDLARSLFDQAKNPDAQNYMSLIRACGQENDVPRALELFGELRRKGPADTAAYNCTLDVCVTCGDREAASSLFEEMKAAGRVDVISYNTLLKLYLGQSGHSVTAKVDALIAEMRTRGLKPNTATYNSLLGGALAAGNLNKAWQIIDSMEASGQGSGIDAHTLSMLFKGLRRERNAVDASSVDRALALIEKHRVSVDEVLVNAALEACICLRDASRLTVALRTFKLCGWEIPKECAMHTYGMLIKAYGHSDQLGMALQLWREVKCERCLVPSEQLYGQMIDVLVSNNRLDEAIQLLEEMKKTHGERLTSQGFSVAYGMVIRGFAQRKDCTRALAYYDEMQAACTPVSLVVFNTLIDACCRACDMESGSRIFGAMLATPCTPDLITYSTMIKGHCLSGQVDEAMQLFNQMRKKGIKPDAIVYNSILDGCAKKQMPVLCEQVVKDMIEDGVSPSNYSVSILIKLYGRCKDLESAFRMLRELPKKYGFRPNAAVYTCLMSACIGNGRVDSAVDLLQQMLQERAYPDQKTYSTLLRGTLRSQNAELCVQVIRAALEQRSRGEQLLEEELVQSVLHLLQRRRLWADQGAPLLEQLREAGVRVHCPGAFPKDGNDGSADSPTRRAGGDKGRRQNAAHPRA